MSGFNRAQLIGNLGRDPEVRTTQRGTKVVTLRIATGETWKDKATGERKESTEWHQVVIFNEPLAEIAEKFLRKGSRCMIEGKLQTRKWTDQQGVDRWSTEIVLQQFNGTILLMDTAKGDPGRNDVSSQESERYVGTAAPPKPAATSYTELDDDVPF